jgi:hypothetical protein
MSVFCDCFNEGFCQSEDFAIASNQDTSVDNLVVTIAAICIISVFLRKASEPQ